MRLEDAEHSRPEPAGVTSLPNRRQAQRLIALDRSLEAFPLFRLSDSSESAPVVFTDPRGGRWRVIPAPSDRLPGTFDQDVYVEIMRRYGEAGYPADGAIAFTLHDFLRSMSRRVDGRTYEQLRGALGRLHRTTLESTGAYTDAALSVPANAQFTVLSAISVARRRAVDRDQLGLFSVISAHEPGDARVTIAAPIRSNILAGHVTTLLAQQYLALASPVTRRLYRLLEVVRAGGQTTWRIPLAELAAILPLTQKYPSHLVRVVQPANEMLVAAGIARSAQTKQLDGDWTVEYVLPALASRDLPT